jgi:ribosomal protein S18 acetylase RimI-like enzyme
MWEVNCVAVDSEHRGQGRGARLHARAEEWLVDQGACTLQVKTLAESHPSTAYAETRKFYRALGFKPLEVFPTLWAPHLPVLQLVKVLPSAAEPLNPRPATADAVSPLPPVKPQGQLAADGDK